MRLSLKKGEWWYRHHHHVKEKSHLALFFSLFDDDDDYNHLINDEFHWIWRMVSPYSGEISLSEINRIKKEETRGIFFFLSKILHHHPWRDSTQLTLFNKKEWTVAANIWAIVVKNDETPIMYHYEMMKRVNQRWNYSRKKIIVFTVKRGRLVGKIILKNEPLLETARFDYIFISLPHRHTVCLCPSSSRLT